MKYNSIGQQLVAKAKEIDPSYKDDKFNDMSEALDIILNNSSSSGKPIFSIYDYLEGESRSTISQEGFNLLEEKIFSGEIVGILAIGEPIPAFLTGYVIESGKLTGYIFETGNIGGENQKIIIYKNLSVSVDFSEGGGGSSKIWYNIGNINLFDPQPITQEQYNEMKTLAESDSLAGIVSRFDTIAYIPLQHIDNGTFTFQSLSYGKDDFQNFTNDSFTITIKHDLSVSLSLDQKPLFSIPTQGGVFIPCASGAVQQNLTIGNGLKIEDGALKTTIPPLPSDASTKTYNLKAVNGTLTWVE